MIVGDLYDIESRLKEYDPDLSLSFDYEREQYKVIHSGYPVLTIPHGQLDARVVERIRRIDHANRKENIVYEMDRHNERLDKRREREVEDMAYNMGKDIRPYFNKDSKGPLI